MDSRLFETLETAGNHPPSEPDTETGQATAAGDSLASRIRKAFLAPSVRMVSYSGIALPVLALVSSVAWVFLIRWYSLLDNRNNTHFAFEKIPGHFASPIMRWTLVLFLVVALAYAAGWWLLSRTPVLSFPARAGALGLVIGPAMANLLIYPVGALDAFNYLIELKLAFHFDQNPYLVTFATHRADPFALPAFLVDIPLFYGPAWLLSSGLPGLAVGYGDPVNLLLGLKTLNLVLIGLIAVVLHRAAGGGKAGWIAAFLFAANPLVLFEGVANAHNDVLVTVFLIAALVALRSRSVFAAPLLALSVLVKFFTAALAPLFLAVMIRDGWGWRRIAASTVLAVAGTAALVIPFWADGAMMDGLVQGTAKSQLMDHVSPLSLAKQVARDRRSTLPSGFPPVLPGNACPVRGQAVDDVPPPLAAWLACGKRPQTKGLLEFIDRAALGVFTVLALLIAVAVWRGRSLELAAIETMMLFILLATNFFPWYLIPIFAAAVLIPRRRVLTYLFAATALGLAYYPAYVFARFDSGWTGTQRHLFLALFLTVPMLVFLGAEIMARLRTRVRKRNPVSAVASERTVAAASR